MKKQKSIKARVFDKLQKKFKDTTFTRADVVTAYRKVTGKTGNVGHLSTSLCNPCGTQGYFCWSTSKEPRYIKCLARNTYKLITDEPFYYGGYGTY